MGQKTFKKLVCFWGNKVSKNFAFEISWPLIASSGKTQFHKNIQESCPSPLVSSENFQWLFWHRLLALSSCISLKSEPQNCVPLLHKHQLIYFLLWSPGQDSVCISNNHFCHSFLLQKFLSISYRLFFQFVLKIERSHQLLSLLQGNLSGGIDNKTLRR